MRILATSAIVLTLTARAAASEPQSNATEVVVLGVAHSAMLVAETYRPAVFRAYFERVGPDAVCIERPPEEFAQGSHYEFTYEIQNIAVPFARERGIALCPFDWIPAKDDQMLAWGVDLENLPFIRQPGSYATFLTHSGSDALSRDLFFAENEDEKRAVRDWHQTVPDSPRTDFARRLFLYRTFLQAMRIADAARHHQGGRLLVVVGSMHKEDIEGILADEPGIEIVHTSRFGKPGPEEVAKHVRLDDLAAIASFNLLGAQAQTGTVDWDWLRGVVARLEAEKPGPEARLFAIRLAVLTGAITSAAAAERYRAIRRDASAEARFTWTGVLERRRIDSFADPFGNLTISGRALVEEAREREKLGELDAALALRSELVERLSPLKAGQLEAYWADWVSNAD